MSTQQAELGRDLMLVGQLTEAAELLGQAVNADPDRPLFHQWLADTWHRQGDPRRAGEEYRRVLQREPSSPRAHLMLARINEAAGQAQDALRHYEAFLAAAPSHAAKADVLRSVAALRGPKATNFPPRG